MVTISVKSNIGDVLKQLAARREQVPFAIAKALTDTAKEAQATIRQELPQRFTIRTPWVAKGIRIRSATKQSLTAMVYDVDPFMRIQETGGTKASINRRVFDFGDMLAIPVDARRSKRDVVRKEDWPQNLIEPFIITAKDGRKYLAVHSLAKKVRGQRGKFTIGKDVGGNRIMYVLKPRVQVPARFGFAETVRKVVVEKFSANLRQSIQLAMATAR